MKITLKKERKTLSVRFQAHTKRDGINLRDAVISAAKKKGANVPVAIVEHLAGCGYTREILSVVDVDNPGVKA